MNFQALKEIDWQAVSKDVLDQFKNLDTSNPGVWPFAPRFVVWVVAACAAVGLIWYGFITPKQDAMSGLKAEEERLKEDFIKKTQASINLERLKLQKIQVQAYVSQLENQLPGRAEIAKLLSDVNQAGVSRGLQFELFKPSPEVVKEFYAERGVNIAVTGRFHDVGEFSAGIAQLPRIVSLSDISLKSSEVLRDSLRMEAVIHTYRYLDDNEIAESKKATEKK